MYTVLICDDDRAILDSVEIYLKAEGYAVLKASDGLQALELVQKNEVQCVVLDIMMPRMDGITAMLRIRDRYNCPIILLSAKGEDTDKIAGLSFGADDYVTKPYNPLELVARVKSQIRRYVSLGSRVEKGRGDLRAFPSICGEQIGRVAGDGIRLVGVEGDFRERPVNRRRIKCNGRESHRNSCH